jgi:hypothetical protein
MPSKKYKMTLTEWDELYRRTYDAYDYAGLCNDEVMEKLGTILDNLIDNKPEPANK